jgi:hypothetical protein
LVKKKEGRKDENETNYPKQIVEYQPWKYENRKECESARYLYGLWASVLSVCILIIHVKKEKKRKDPSGYTRHLTALSRSTISNWCRWLQTAHAAHQYSFTAGYVSTFVCRNSRSRRNKKMMMTNCWPFILHNSECQWHIYTRAVREKKREKRVRKNDEWHDNMIMCVYKSAKNDNSIRETNRQQCYIHPEREKKKIGNCCK